LLGLSVQEMGWALGLAATQAAGLREMFGSMSKAFHPGRAAQNGYTAALLAQAGFTSGEHALEGPRGFAAVQAAASNLSRITAGLGREFSLRGNTYKPFPCGIVIHPTIDACIQLRQEHSITPVSIADVRLWVAPLVLDLCDKKEISRGLEGKFSVYHAAALGLVRGRAGLQDFSDEAVNDPAVRAVRERTTARADETVTEDGVCVEVELADGRTLTKRLEHSLGNLERPMTDRQLDDKFLGQAVLAIPHEQAERLLALCWKIDSLDDVGSVIEAATPRG
jgi:2-methylcitrate dehydratase PrpD